ncbi:MAG TPA: DUF4404 family protein [Verrucomicrobiae bacterium]|nr:DUF4404 family protein [Verrucomicrobiae bacterium]
MIENTIAELEAKIRSESLSEDRRHELLQLLATLKTQLSERDKTNLKPLKSSVEELRASVEGFEKSHPQLVQTVNNISSVLANLGI